MGCSAGGHLASLLATSCETEAMRPNFQILLYPVITMQANLTNSGTRNKFIGTNPTEEQIQKYSTDKRVNAQTPQAFLTLSSDDYGVRPANSLLYFESLLRYQFLWLCTSTLPEGTDGVSKIPLNINPNGLPNFNVG